MRSQHLNTWHMYGTEHRPYSMLAFALSLTGLTAELNKMCIKEYWCQQPKCLQGKKCTGTAVAMFVRDNSSRDSLSGWISKWLLNIEFTIGPYALMKLKWQKVMYV